MGMKKHAELLLPSGQADVLNVGFGLGLVDESLQAQKPRCHHIIEPHPDVLAEARRQGWHKRAGVVLHEGRWQDVLDKLPDASLDAVFFDTWDETYVDLHA